MYVMLLLSALTLVVWTYLALLHGRFWLPYFLETSQEPQQWPSVSIIVPARDEADVLPKSLASLLAQDYPGQWSVFLIDDHSTDGTAEVARKLAVALHINERLTVIAAQDLRSGWSGKVAAMQAGYQKTDAEYILFTDADIEHTSSSLRQLVAHAVDQRLDLTSLMVRLRCRDVAEKLLIPAFVFFFAMLYPFRRVSDEGSRVAAAAGGVMLLRRGALNAIGGLHTIRNALIDDCALANAVKKAGGSNGPGRIELALARDVKSLRAYPKIADVWSMIARTAFNQLRYSPLLLIGTVFGMGVLFLVPPLMPLIASFKPALLAFFCWILMTLLYLPTITYYRLPWYWALTLPIAGLIYTGATVDSALRYWRGKGGQWKGRIQA